MHEVADRSTHLPWQGSLRSCTPPHSICTSSAVLRSIGWRTAVPRIAIDCNARAEAGGGCAASHGSLGRRHGMRGSHDALTEGVCQGVCLQIGDRKSEEGAAGQIALPPAFPPRRVLFLLGTWRVLHSGLRFGGVLLCCSPRPTWHISCEGHPYDHLRARCASQALCTSSWILELHALGGRWGWLQIPTFVATLEVGWCQLIGVCGRV